MKLNRIKTLWSAKGISQVWLAKQLDKSFSMVNTYACNRIQPNLETLPPDKEDIINLFFRSIGFLYSTINRGKNAIITILPFCVNCLYEPILEEYIHRLSEFLISKVE